MYDHGLIEAVTLVMMTAINVWKTCLRTTVL